MKMLWGQFRPRPWKPPDRLIREAPARLKPLREEGERRTAQALHDGPAMPVQQGTVP
ncbi:hypothetical protein HNP60_003710 [Sphingobium sp. B1D3A]|uniref:Uncharacterized protein n=1 Tax=Sphingobium lignivorans TaxID=2735886 RepID=A0ABR6NKC3_9SPHN|nr:hypothetical protein [Sphingobium lignivorans]